MTDMDLDALDLDELQNKYYAIDPHWSFLDQRERDKRAEEINGVRELIACNHECGAYIEAQERANGTYYYKVCKNCGERKGVKTKDLTRRQRQGAVVYNGKSYEHPLQIRQRKREYVELVKIAEKWANYAINKKQNWWKEYDAYLKTERWMAKRELVIKRCGNLCEGCGVSKVDHIHHLTYERVFDEMLFDLVGLCCQCHKKLHKDQQL